MVMKTAHTPKPRSKVREQAIPYESKAEGMTAPSQQIAAGEFKARCLALMDELQERGGEYVITKRGVPVARLLPVRVERRRLLGSMKGTVKTLGDIVAPLEEPWDALERWDDE
jgi:prevent-host-death family protein